MGNCHVMPRLDQRVQSVDRKILRIVRMDGKVLEYGAPLLVGDLLENFEGCGVGMWREESRLLPHDYEMRLGKMYYLLPMHGSTQSLEEKGSVGRRIKVLLTKQQLQELLEKRMSVEEVISGIQRREIEVVGDAALSWRPKLETIHEGREWLH